MKRFLAIAVLLLMAAPAQAQVFGELNRITVTKTLLRFGAINAGSDDVLDDYLKLTECAKYRKLYRDDFAMQAWREQTRAALKHDAQTFPDSYYFKSHMYLDTYDFNNKSFPLTEKSQLRNVNSFSLINANNDNACVMEEPIRNLPNNIGAVLDQPVRLTGIPLSEEKGRALLQRMNKRRNFNREVYVRFSLMVAYAPPITVDVRTIQRYNMDAQLLSIEFFEDPGFTKPIWVFTRS